MNESKLIFQWYDYITFVLMLSVTFAVGGYYSYINYKKKEDADEYTLGNRTMKMTPIIISLIASHVSPLHLLMIPSDIYTYGGSFWLTCLMTPITATIICFVFLPVFYKSQYRSIYEYLEQRFDLRTRILASILYSGETVLSIPVLIYMSALACATVTRFNFELVVICLSVFCISYTVFGGLRSVIWTDNSQFAFTCLFLLIVTIEGTVSLGGHSILTEFKKGERFDFFNFNPDITIRNTFWSCSLGLGFFITLSQCAVHPTYVLKYMTVKSLRQAQVAIYIMMFGAIGVISSICFIGMLIFAKYAECDPVKSGNIISHDQIVPYFIMDISSKYPAVGGMFISGIIAATFSTVSAALNCAAVTIYKDFFRFKNPPSGEKETTYLKLITSIVGLIGMVLAFAYQQVSSGLGIILGVTSTTNGPILGMFTLGLIFPKASRKGVFWGGLAGCISTFSIIVINSILTKEKIISTPTKPFSTAGCASNITNMTNMTFDASVSIEPTVNYMPNEPFFLFRISVFYYAAVGTLVTIVVGLILSYTCMRGNTCTNKNLLSPVIFYFEKKNEECLIIFSQIEEGNENKEENENDNDNLNDSVVIEMQNENGNDSKTEIETGSLSKNRNGGKRNENGGSEDGSSIRIRIKNGNGNGSGSENGDSNGNGNGTKSRSRNGNSNRNSKNENNGNENNGNNGNENNGNGNNGNGYNGNGYNGNGSNGNENNGNGNNGNGNNGNNENETNGNRTNGNETNGNGTNVNGTNGNGTNGNGTNGNGTNGNGTNGNGNRKHLLYKKLFNIKED